MNKNNQISGYPSPGETSQATDYGDINFDQILNDHYIALPKSAAAQAQIHTKKMTSHNNDKEIIPSPFPVPSPARSSYSPPPHKTPNLPSSFTINNSGGNKSAVRDIMDEFYSVMQDIQDSTGVFNPVPYAASKIDVDYDLIKATTRSSFVNNVDVIEETHRMYHEYESEQPDRQSEESGFWPPWKAPLAQTDQFMEEKKGRMPSLVSSLENTQQWRRNIEIDDESNEESDEEEDMVRQFEKNAAMEEELLSGIGGLAAIPIMTTTYRDEPSTQFHPSSTSRYFSNSHSDEVVGVEEEDESEVFVEGEVESNNENENADLSEEMIDEMLFLPNSATSAEGVRSSRSKSLRFSENNDENEEDSTLPVNDGHQLEINQEKAEKRSLLREIEANLPQSRSRRPPSQRSPSSSVSQSQSTYATTEIFQSSGLQYDENIPSIQHFSTLPLALQEIEKLNRIKESLLDALYDTKQQLAHTQDTVTQEKEKNYELITVFEIEKENQRLQTLSLQQQIRILTQEHSIQEIYQIYEKDLQRLKQENERLYDRNLTLELQYESSGVVPPSQVTHSPSGASKGAGNSAQRKGVSGRVKVVPTSDEDEMRQIEREEKHIQQIQHASDVISVRNKEEGEGRRGKEGILKASSDGGDPSSQLTVTTYEYQQLLKRYQTLIQKYKQCAIEKQSWKQSYETLKSQDRKHHLHEKLYTDLQLRHKKISYEYQQMKQVIDKQSQQLLEKQKDYQTIINDYNELKRENEIIKKEQSEYLMKIQQATKVIHELREEKTRLTHFYQFLYKHQAKGLITSLSPPVMKDLQNMSIDDVLEREEREEERRKKRDTVRMKDENRMVEPYQSHEQSRKNNKKEVFGKNYQLALQNFYKYYNDDMTTTKIPTPSSLHTMAAVKSEIAKNMASDGMMGLGNASDKENHQFLRTMETERLIQNSDGRKGGANNRISTRVEPRSYSTKYSHSPGAASTPIPAPKSWKK